jgi:hypothetical protein
LISPVIVGTANDEERPAALGVEAVDRLEQPDAGDLEDVLVGLAARHEAPGEAARERQEAPGQHVAIGAIARVREPPEQLAIHPDPGRVGGVDDGGRLVSCTHGVGPPEVVWLGLEDRVGVTYPPRQGGNGEAPPGGLEPPARCLEGSRSIH